MKRHIEAIAAVAARAGLSEEDARRCVTIPKERDRADLTLPCFRLGKPPHEVAQRVAEAFEPNELLASAEAAGPFVNFRIERASFIASVLDAIGEDYGSSTEGAEKSVVIDYGSPNIAKPLQFHHLRSAAIGQALCNLLRWRGYTVIGVNFLGDVGTAFGKLMVGIEHFGEADDADALNERYVKASKLCAGDEAKMDEARAWAKRLEDGDEDARRLWENARRISLQGFARVYDLLSVRHDVVDGEQMYVAPAKELVERLLGDGRAEISEGAAVIETKEGVYLLRKSDGTTLYSTRDIAAARDRFERYGFAHSLYVVDIAQSHHFKLLFASLKAIGHDWADRCRHVAFGQVLMGGRRTATREGRGVLLLDVLEEGVARARKIMEEKNADLPDRDAVARAVGVGAVVFSDVGYPVRKDINFDWDEILSFDGRTGPYLQYVHASACSIIRKGGDAAAADLSLLTNEREWDLVRRLSEFDDVVARSCREFEPSHLSNFLYDLAREFRGYHTAGGRDRSLRVLVDDDALRGARLRLVDGIRQTLAIGLRLLGVKPVEEM